MNEINNACSTIAALFFRQSDLFGKLVSRGF